MKKTEILNHILRVCNSDLAIAINSYNKKYYHEMGMIDGKILKTNNPNELTQLKNEKKALSKKYIENGECLPKSILSYTNIDELLSKYGLDLERVND